MFLPSPLEICVGIMTTATDLLRGRPRLIEIRSYGEFTCLHVKSTALSTAVLSSNAYNISSVGLCHQCRPPCSCALYGIKQRSNRYIHTVNFSINLAIMAGNSCRFGPSLSIGLNANASCAVKQFCTAVEACLCSVQPKRHPASS